MQDILSFIAFIVILFFIIKFRIWWKSLPYKKALKDIEREKQKKQNIDI